MPIVFILSLLAVLQPEAETFATRALSIPSFLPELLWALLVLTSITLHVSMAGGGTCTLEAEASRSPRSNLVQKPPGRPELHGNSASKKNIHMYKCCLSPVITKEDLKFKVYVPRDRRRFLPKHQISFNMGGAWIPSGDRS